MTPFEQAKPWRYNGLKEWTAVVRNKNGQTQAASVRYSDSDAIELSLNENWEAKVSAVERSDTKRTPPTVVQLKFDSEPDEAGVVSEFEKKYPHLKVERVNSIREKKWPVFEPKIGDTVSLYKPLSGAPGRVDDDRVHPAGLHPGLSFIPRPQTEGRLPMSDETNQPTPPQPEEKPVEPSAGRAGRRSLRPPLHRPSSRKQKQKSQKTLTADWSTRCVSSLPLGYS